ncbi:MAG: regulatory iron-sulfur-containing complex subunit RicT [Sphaerochaetaceae bacterium]|jgi:cell fate regulator YaaT (PSP1 superfamily)|nr:regulatory iron-sulfur-containing complex subunit RicT [Sphaerochaetaceae bacterium]NLV83074.1 hypothetical protein [Spirochaetales bacterium]
MKNSNHIQDSNHKKQGESDFEIVRGYVYLVRNPSSNEISICASHTKLKRGTKVIAPTRYGLDYCMVVGSAHSFSDYSPGSTDPHGACLHVLEPVESFEPNDDLLAAGDPKDFGLLEEMPQPNELSLELNVVEVGQPACGGCFDLHDELVEIDGDIEWIERVASEDDERRVREYSQMEEEALHICREKVQYHALDMKLVTAHYLFGEPKIIFFFTAANRVDFRELVKDLVSVFKVRIELRQIGVRDESRVLGGLAVCGRDFCCHCVTDKLNPVSIKMAKEQNLSLNSTKISGPCGRLLCCLSYEYDFYYEEKQKLPPEGSRMKVRQDLMKVAEVNILSRKITLIGPEGRFLSVPFERMEYSEESNRWEIEKQYLDEILSI